METIKKRGRKRLDDKDKVKSLSICLPLKTIRELEKLASLQSLTVSKLIKDMIDYSTNYNSTFNNFKE